MKAALENEARRKGATLAALLDGIAAEWLESKQRSNPAQEEEQLRLHAAAARSYGRIAGGAPKRSEQVRVAVRQRLTARHGR